jgi:hypothetical protein
MGEGETGEGEREAVAKVVAGWEATVAAAMEEVGSEASLW